MDILDLRHFTSADLRPLLEKESREWSRLMEWDYSGSAEMILRYVDAKILPGYAALHSGHITGYSFFVYEGNKGVIGDMFVEANGSGLPAGPIGEELLTHVIETLQQSPGIHRVEAQLLVHDTGMAMKPFQQGSFRRFPRVFMSVPLGKPLPIAAAAFPDLEFRPWSEQDFQPAAALITASYRGHIDAEINDQYRNVAGSMRFLNNIVRFPGCGTFDASSSLVALQKGTRAMVGLVLCSRVKEDVGHVTQICVVPEHRGRGIAQAMIAACFAELHRQKLKSLTLTVTEANRQAIDLYLRIGFTRKRVFDAFVWEG